MSVSVYYVCVCVCNRERELEGRRERGFCMHQGVSETISDVIGD